MSDKVDIWELGTGDKFIRDGKIYVYMPDIEWGIHYAVRLPDGEVVEFEGDLLVYPYKVIDNK